MLHSTYHLLVADQAGSCTGLLLSFLPPSSDFHYLSGPQWSSSSLSWRFQLRHSLLLNWALRNPAPLPTLLCSLLPQLSLCQSNTFKNILNCVLRYFNGFSLSVSVKTAILKSWKKWLKQVVLKVRPSHGWLCAGSMDCSLPRLLSPWDQARRAGVGCHALRIFTDPGTEPTHL